MPEANDMTVGMLTRRGGRWHVSNVGNLLERLPGQATRLPSCRSAGGVKVQAIVVRE